MAKKLMKGTEAICEGAIRGGCRCFFGYPITPQNEIPEYMSANLPKVGGSFVQAECEVAAINMVYGAAGAGARAMTSSSSPGVSLKQEGISYIAGAELPCLIVNIVRAGPGLGGIQPSQCDYFQATKGGGHGDYHLLVYGPATVQEAVDLAYTAFETSEKYRVPVMILGDGMLGQMMEPVELPEPIDLATVPYKEWATYGDGKGHRVINSLYIDSHVGNSAANRAGHRQNFRQFARGGISRDLIDLINQNRSRHGDSFFVCHKISCTPQQGDLPARQGRRAYP